MDTPKTPIPLPVFLFRTTVCDWCHRETTTISNGVGDICGQCLLDLLDFLEGIADKVQRHTAPPS